MTHKFTSLAAVVLWRSVLLAPLPPPSTTAPALLAGLKLLGSLGRKPVDDASAGQTVQLRQAAHHVVARAPMMRGIDLGKRGLYVPCEALACVKRLLPLWTTMMGDGD